MPRKGRSNEEIVHALHQVDGGEKVAEVCRRLGVSEQAFYRWKKQVAGLGVQELRELRSLRDENRKLKQVVADLTLDRHILQEIVRKKSEASRTLCTLAEWAQTTYRLSQRRAARLIPVRLVIRCEISLHSMCSDGSMGTRQPGIGTKLSICPCHSPHGVGRRAPLGSSRRRCGLCVLCDRQGNNSGHQPPVHYAMGGDDRSGACYSATTGSSRPLRGNSIKNVDSGPFDLTVNE
jgi:putative transposase